MSFEKLEQQVADMMRRHEQRKADIEVQEAQRLLAASRSCLSEESDAVTPSELSGVILGRLTAGVAPMDPEFEKSRAWDTVIAEELERNRVPKRYRYEMGDWGCVDQRKVFGLCRRTLVGTGAIVAMIGLRGTGKTTIACQLIIERCWQDYKTVFVAQQRGAMARWMPYRKMSDLIALLKPLYADFGSIDSDRLVESRAALSRADLLIIDELHDCEDQKMKDRILTDLIDRRYSNMKDTVLISNQTPDEFELATSDSVLSRIDEHGIKIPCNWISFRAKDPSMPKPRHSESQD